MIAPIAPFTPPIVTTVAPSTATAAPSDFKDLLSSSIAAVEGKQDTAKTAVNRFLSGETDELHSAALAGQRAELSLELFLQVRNKVVQAYQEVMRMQM